MHLIIDGYGANTKLLEDRDLIANFLDSYPATIGMHKVAPPRVFRYVGSKPEDWGFSGFVLIAESHISIHTFVERSYINIDVFSCRSFDFHRVIQDIKETFQLTKIHSCILNRGLEYLEAKRLEAVA